MVVVVAVVSDIEVGLQAAIVIATVAGVEVLQALTVETMLIETSETQGLSDFRVSLDFTISSYRGLNQKGLISRGVSTPGVRKGLRVFIQLAR